MSKIWQIFIKYMLNKYFNLKGSDSIKTKNKIEENEIPKSVLKMKKDKEKRENEEISDHRLCRFYWFQLCLLYAEKI